VLSVVVTCRSPGCLLEHTKKKMLAGSAMYPRPWCKKNPGKKATRAACWFRNNGGRPTLLLLLAGMLCYVVRWRKRQEEGRIRFDLARRATRRAMRLADSTNLGERQHAVRWLSREKTMMPRRGHSGRTTALGKSLSTRPWLVCTHAS
jgi:hypothetical protein